MSIGQRIADRRKQLGLSQEDLCKLMGYKTKSSICRIENGENDIPQKKISQFAKVLDCSEAYLMEWTDDINHTTGTVKETSGADNLLMSQDELDIIKIYRSLSPASQQKLLELTKMFQAAEDNKK